MLPKFYKCHRKEQSRQDTIIDAYRSIFNRNSIPSDRQYWTLCNFQADDDGNIPEASEVGQLIESGLLSINQIYGVDFYSNVIDHNKTYIPYANWFNGELYDTIIQNINIFNPSIINIDLNCMVRRSIRVATKILRLINDLKIKDILIVLNVMVTNPRRKNILTLDELNEIFIEKFLHNDIFLYNAKGWNIYGDDKLYSYHGTGKKGKTTMSSLLLWK
jgi:hypothetical protein